MKNVMHSVVRCLATSLLLLVAFVSFAQEPEYIKGYGCVRNPDGSLNEKKCIEEAIEHLCSKISEEAGVQVSTHTTLKNKNGKEEYNSVTVVDSGIMIPRNAIEIIHWDGFWIARIERSKVFPREVKWVEQNITVNNTYNAAPTYSRGFQRTQSTRVTTRRTDVRGPSGRIVHLEPGRTTTTTTRSSWNGRYGWSYERTK